jgi:hypothetical protein
MKSLLLVLALFAVLWGSLLLLPLLAWASLQDPTLVGMDYFAAVIATLLSNPTAPAGMAVLVLGVAAGLHAALLVGNDRHERMRALLWFWTALGAGCLVVFALLLAVNLLGLQSGEVGPIARWVWR